jgi:dihydrofolate synthase/folylpolyglutamate synthase
VVVDGAHNPSAARRLVPALRGYFRCDRVILVFGALTGHAAGEVLSEFAGLSPTVLAVRSRHPRSAPAERVAGAARDLGLQVAMETDDIGSATRQALEMAGEGDLVLGTGSLSVAAEVTEGICGIRPELYPSLERAGTSRTG